jgi:hypothetical protein
MERDTGYVDGPACAACHRNGVQADGDTCDECLTWDYLMEEGDGMETQEFISAMAEARAIADGATVEPRTSHIEALLSAIDSLAAANRELQVTVDLLARWTWDEPQLHAGRVMGAAVGRAMRGEC